ncbi:MAG: hypothetical protein QXR84_01110 [Candidatus Bathyarchaeia archaeon]|nr:hypothetical protein [Candidatus Bathyarchaeota archaeon]
MGSAILNLMKAKKEVSTPPEEFRRIVSYMEAKDVLEATQLLQRLNEILAKLELVKRA